MDWIAFIKSLLPSFHDIVHFLDSLFHRKTNRELDFVYSNSTDLNSVYGSNSDSIEILRNLFNSKKSN